MDDLVGRQLDNYSIDAKVGDGGMGAVYRATDLTLDRPVAMKVMHGDLAGDPAFQQRFLQEARAAARLVHPSIVRVYQFGNRDDLIYIVMELVDGLSLGDYLRQLTQHQQVVRLDESLSLIAQVADALGYAHRQGVIHRDVKPDNILVKRLDRPDRPGEPPLRSMITDFGLAKLLEAEMDTQMGQMMGTLPYMAPEQVLDQPVDGRADIYSLGVVLYQLATGKVPLVIKTPEEAVRAHQYETIPLPSEVNPAIPPQVEQVIMKALAREPELRYQTGEELAVALRAAGNMLGDEEAAAFIADSNSTIVSMVAEFPTPVRRVRWDMRPRELVNAGICRVLVENDSPEAQTLTVSVEDPQGGLAVDAPRKQLLLGAGQQGMVDFYMEARKQTFTGRRRDWPFVMRVGPAAASGGANAEPPPGLDGTLQMRPQLPLWLALLLLVLLLALCGLLVWALTFLPSLESLLGRLGF